MLRVRGYMVTQNGQNVYHIKTSHGNSYVISRSKLQTIAQNCCIILNLSSSWQRKRTENKTKRSKKNVKNTDITTSYKLGYKLTKNPGSLNSPKVGQTKKQTILTQSASFSKTRRTDCERSSSPLDQDSIAWHATLSQRCFSTATMIVNYWPCWWHALS